MKKRGIMPGIIAGIAIIGLFSSCEEIDGLFEDFALTITSDYYETEIAIPPVEAGTAFSTETVFREDLENLLAEHGYGNATINSVNILDAMIEVSGKSRIETLNAIDTVSISASTAQLIERTIACQKNNQVNATFLSLDISDSDVTSYIESEACNLTYFTGLKENIDDTLWVSAKIQYEINFTVETLEE